MLTRDALIVFSLSASFALWVTAHLAIVYGLLWRPPRWRAWVALVVVPLSPLWALRERMRGRAIAFLIGALAYLVSLTIALRV